MAAFARLLRTIRTVLAHDPRGLFGWSILDRIRAEEERDRARQKAMVDAQYYSD